MEVREVREGISRTLGWQDLGRPPARPSVRPYVSVLTNTYLTVVWSFTWKMFTQFTWKMFGSGRDISVPGSSSTSDLFHLVHMASSLSGMVVTLCALMVSSCHGLTWKPGDDSIADFADSSNSDWLQEGVDDKFELWMTSFDMLQSLQAKQATNHLINLALNEWKLGCGGGVACYLKSPRLRGRIVFLRHHRQGKVVSAITSVWERLRRSFDALLDITASIIVIAAALTAKSHGAKAAICFNSDGSNSGELAESVERHAADEHLCQHIAESTIAKTFDVIHLSQQQEMKLPGLGAESGITVKEFDDRSVAGGARALDEVLTSFEQMLSTAQQTCSNGSQVVKHAWIMARVDTGFHCFGVYAESRIRPHSARSKTRLLFFDPSWSSNALLNGVLDFVHHMRQHRDVYRDPLNAEVYESCFMLPMFHFEPADDGAYFGVSPRPDGGMGMIRGRRSQHQLSLHSGNTCGMFVYFAMRYFVTLAEKGLRVFDELSDSCKPFVWVKDSMWDSSQPKPFSQEGVGKDGNILQSEAMPINVFKQHSARLACREHMMFTAAAFPKPFDFFAEKGPLGAIDTSVQGLPRKMMTSSAKGWVKALESARMLPEQCSHFRQQCYLKLLLD